eukprot:m.291221 g.291221  ORF g.291221 m.291221 type:complete len:480 (-) comp15825_c2_seq5:1318-2757(-)
MMIQPTPGDLTHKLTTLDSGLGVQQVAMEALLVDTGAEQSHVHQAQWLHQRQQEFEALEQEQLEVCVVKTTASSLQQSQRSSSEQRHRRLSAPHAPDPNQLQEHMSHAPALRRTKSATTNDSGISGSDGASDTVYGSASFELTHEGEQPPDPFRRRKPKALHSPPLHTPHNHGQLRRRSRSNTVSGVSPIHACATTTPKYSAVFSPDMFVPPSSSSTDLDSPDPFSFGFDAQIDQNLTSTPLRQQPASASSNPQPSDTQLQSLQVSSMETDMDADASALLHIFPQDKHHDSGFTAVSGQRRKHKTSRAGKHQLECSQDSSDSQSSTVDPACGSRPSRTRRAGVRACDKSRDPQRKRAKKIAPWDACLSDPTAAKHLLKMQQSFEDAAGFELEEVDPGSSAASEAVNECSDALRRLLEPRDPGYVPSSEKRLLAKAKQTHPNVAAEYLRYKQSSEKEGIQAMSFTAFVCRPEYIDLALFE